MFKPRHLLPLLCAALLCAPAWAQDALIRKNLAERLPNLPKIDEISKTPIPGLYEVRFGQDIVYTDEQGNYLIQGNLIDTKTRTDLTEARLNKLSAIDFASLPLKDAVVIKQGNGTRRMAELGDRHRRSPPCERNPASLRRQPWPTPPAQRKVSNRSSSFLCCSP